MSLLGFCGNCSAVQLKSNGDPEKIRLNSENRFCWILLVELAIPWRHQYWQIRPVSFARQRPLCPLGLLWPKKHTAEIVAAIDGIEPILGAFKLPINDAEESKRSSTPTLILIVATIDEIVLARARYAVTGRVAVDRFFDLCWVDNVLP